MHLEEACWQQPVAHLVRSRSQTLVAGAKSPDDQKRENHRERLCEPASSLLYYAEKMFCPVLSGSGAIARTIQSAIRV